MGVEDNRKADILKKVKVVRLSFVGVFVNRYLPLCVILSALTFSLPGCGAGGPPMGKVKGTVKLDGKPMPKLMVTFIPKSGGQTSTGVTNSDGVYELLGTNSKGALVGLHTVSITTMLDPAVSVPTDMPSDSDAYANQGSPAQYTKAAVQNREKIPARYNTQTELAEEVKSGSQTIDFDLKSK